MIGCKWITGFIDISKLVNNGIGRDILQFLANGLVASILVLLVMVICFSRTEEFKYYLGMVKNFLQKKRQK
jgi:hypothetical protein